ncbi:MAG TPA: hypothetical protein VGN07_20520 [Steroidobacteraceae bacterium]|jgi:hypothetical protein
MGRIALLVGLLVALAPAYAAKSRKVDPPRPCACNDVATLEREITEQQYLANTFAEWAEYLPNSIHDTGELKARALDRFNLAFYGVASEAPQGMDGHVGGAADMGVLYKKASCPLVLYHYKDGKPLMVPDPPLQKGEKRNPLKLKHLITPVSESTYPAGQQCAAMVYYGFAHEQHHQQTCRAQHKIHGEAQWDDPKFFARDDAAAYKAGVAVLQTELDGLRKTCEECDGKWHVTLEYAYTFNDPFEKIVKKGDNHAYPDGTGVQKSGHAKSTRVHATFTTEQFDGATVKAQYTAAAEDQSFQKGYFIMPSQCGSFRKTTWTLDNGAELRAEGHSSGMADASVYSDGRFVRVSLKVPSLKGTFTQMHWNRPKGYCTDEANKPSGGARAQENDMGAVTVSLQGIPDKMNPNEVELFRTEADSGGKGQSYYHVKLRRCSK